MASPAQIDFFRKLTEDRDLGVSNADLPALRQQFEQLNDKNASTWIERALNRPKRAEGDTETIPPPF